MGSSVSAVAWQLLGSCAEKIEEFINQCRHANVLAYYFLVQLQIYVASFEFDSPIGVHYGISPQFQ